MTACIVGWAHTAFGKLAAETVESLIVRVANEALAHAGIGPADVDEILARALHRRLHPAGFPPPDRSASQRRLSLQAGDPRRERLRHRLGRGAPGHQKP